MKILFLGNNAETSSFAQSLAARKKDWHVTPISFFDQPQASFSELRPEVVILDADLCGQSMSQLIALGRAREPDTVFIIVANSVAHEAELKSKYHVHQLIARPYGADQLIRAVEQGCNLKDFLRSKAVLRLVSQIKHLPSFPESYDRLTRVLQNENATLQQITEIIGGDIAMTGKILQIANSTYFSVRQRKVTDLRDAIRLLGVKTIRFLSLAADIFSKFDAKLVSHFNLTQLWEHSLRVGQYAYSIAQALQYPQNVWDEAMAAGVLHDIGRLVLVQQFAKKTSEAQDIERTENLIRYQAERRIFGISHAELGGFLLAKWGLPDAIIEGVAYHHEPLEVAVASSGVLSSVSLANLIDHLNSGDARYDAMAAEAAAFLAQIKSKRSFEELRALCTSSRA